MKPPKISIGMPVYNGEKFIDRAIESLLSQNFIDFELIISDNASTDDTGILCQKYNDNRIKYYRQHNNIGLISNFKFVLDKAVGEYFMWAASDDIWDSKFISSTSEVLDENSDCVSVFCHMILFDINTNDLIEKITPSSNSSDFKFLRIRRALEELHPNLIYGLHRRNVLKENYLLGQFDWSDVLTVSGLVATGKYFIIPKSYYKIGINGNKRKPYSITGKYLKLSIFRKNAINLLLKHSSIFNISCLIEIFKITFKTIYSQIKINKIIKNWSN